MVPETVTAPVTLNVTLDAVPAAVPAKLAAVIAPLPPVPRVSVTPSLSVAAPRVTVPLPAASVELAVTAVALLSVSAVSVVVSVPATEFGPAECTSPPVNVSVSAPFPKATVPLVPNVTAFVTLVVVP